MTKKLAQNVIAENWPKIICKTMLRWPKKKQFFAYNFFSEQFFYIRFRADINMVLLIILMYASKL